MVPFRLLLASNSPRRQQLLAFAGYPFRTAPINIDETPRPGEPADRYVLRLAESKALAAGPLSQPEELILAADTTVADGSQILGKPADPQEADAMLKQLRGHVHQVYSALAVYQPGTGRLEKDLCASQVKMRNYSDAEIEAYIATHDPMDKAGAYAIQNTVFRPVEQLPGCFSSVMGLPLCHLARTLARFGIPEPENLPQVCLAGLEAQCGISAEILQGKDLLS